MLKKILSIILCLSFFTLNFASCKNKGEPKTQTKSYYEYFDTVSVIFSYKGDSEDEFESNCSAVENILSEYHKLFDIYYEYSGINNLMTVNKNAGKSPVKVDGRLIEFLLFCKEMYSLTDGKTNIAAGAVLKLWHDCRDEAENNPTEAKIPDESKLLAASAHCNIDNLIIDEEAGTVYISDPDMSLDVGAIGKGYATEKAANMLISRGVSSYVLNIGGNIRAIGSRTGGDGWLTGITHPDKSSDEQFIRKVNIKNTSLVTSGDYERYYTVDGVDYHHIIDTATLMPADYFSSVSIFTEDSGLADALSTALFCMSYEDGLKLIESIGGIDVIWVDKEFNVRMTDGIESAD